MHSTQFGAKISGKKLQKTSQHVGPKKVLKSLAQKIWQEMSAKIFGNSFPIEFQIYSQLTEKCRRVILESHSFQSAIIVFPQKVGFAEMDQ